MAYADPLDATTPADTDFAGSGDDKIRELKRALIERIESFFQDVEAQPWVPIAGIIPGASLVNGSITSLQLDATTSRAWLAGFFVDTAANPPVPKPGSVPVAALSGAITPDDDSVSTIKVQDLAITEPKMADNSVSSRTVQDDAITAPKIADGAIDDPAKIVDGKVTQSKLDPALVAKQLTVVTANRLFTQAETTVGDSSYKEYDIVCAGAQVGKPVLVQFTAGGYPDGVSAGGAWIGPDELHRGLHAWCLVAGTIRIRFFNKTGTPVDAGAAGATVTVWQFQWLDGHA